MTMFHVCNRKVNTRDNKARNVNDKTIEVDIKVKKGTKNYVDVLCDLDSASTKAECFLCKLKLHGKKKFKCDECELDVCYGCHKKTLITQESLIG